MGRDVGWIPGSGCECVDEGSLLRCCDCDARYRLVKNKVALDHALRDVAEHLVLAGFDVREVEADESRLELDVEKDGTLFRLEKAYGSLFVYAGDGLVYKCADARHVVALEMQILSLGGPAAVQLVRPVGPSATHDHPFKWGAAVLGMSGTDWTLADPLCKWAETMIRYGITPSRLHGSEMKARCDTRSVIVTVHVLVKRVVIFATTCENNALGVVRARISAPCHVIGLLRGDAPASALDLAPGEKQTRVACGFCDGAHVRPMSLRAGDVVFGASARALVCGERVSAFKAVVGGVRRVSLVAQPPWMAAVRDLLLNDAQRTRASRSPPTPPSV